MFGSKKSNVSQTSSNMECRFNTFWTNKISTIVFESLAGIVVYPTVFSLPRVSRRNKQTNEQTNKHHVILFRHWSMSLTSHVRYAREAWVFTCVRAFEWYTRVRFYPPFSLEKTSRESSVIRGRASRYSTRRGRHFRWWGGTRAYSGQWLIARQDYLSVTSLNANIVHMAKSFSTLSETLATFITGPSSVEGG